MSNDTTAAPGRATTDKVRASLARRHARERRFRLYGVGAVALSMLFLVILFTSIVGTGYPAFTETGIRLSVDIDPAEVDPQDLAGGDYRGLVRDALRALFPDVSGRGDRRQLNGLISDNASYRLRRLVESDPSVIGTRQELWVLADGAVDSLVKGEIDRDLPEGSRPVSDLQIAWVDRLQEQGRLERRFSWTLLSNGDSSEPEQAGILGALTGSFYIVLVTLILSFPLGVAAAVYLEEFAPRNRWTDLIEVNINNLAAVPSIVFGLLGLAVFIGFFGLPRSAPLVGGLVLTLMTLPTIIIASRAALKAVPPSIREAALGMGASRMQMIAHHVLPLALPGMLTGTIIGMAQALGETAPLLMIGMVAFIADIPGGPLDPATALPVQIYLWSDLPERAFVARASAAIMVLLGVLIIMNLLAVILRKRFERRW